MRRLLAATLGALAVAAPASAGAPVAPPAPYAAEVRSATTTFQLGGRDGRTWLVRLTLDEVHPVGGAVTRTFDLSLQPCAVDRAKRVHCARASVYRGPADGAVSDDLRSASLRARFAGTALDLSWAVSASHSAEVAAVTDGDVTVRHAYEGGSGVVSGVVLGPRCTATGQVGGAYVARAAGPPPRTAAAPLPRTLPAAIAPARGWAARCV